MASAPCEPALIATHTHTHGDAKTADCSNSTATRADTGVAPAADATGRKEHLVIASHGLHGDPGNVKFLLSCLSDAHPHTIELHAAKANAGWFNSMLSTADGIDLGGERLAAEIHDLLATRPWVRRLSLIGVSLGGLYCRAALAYMRDLEHRVELVNFITYATPHLGVRGHLIEPINSLVGSGVLGATGVQLLLEDASVEMPDTHVRLPFLVWMAMPTSPHAEVLGRFRNKVCVANMEYDDRVPFWSASLALSPTHLAGIADAHPTQLRMEDLPADAAALYPHVHSVYRQAAAAAPMPPMADSHAAAAPTPSSLDAATICALYFPPAQCGLSSAAPAAGAHKLAVETSRSEPQRLEDAMAQYLRAMGGWVNVNALFTEWGASVLNHLRVAVTHPRIASVGADVPKFVAQHTFLP